MPKFAANLTMMFNDVGFLDRFAAAAAAGFAGVEYLFPYDHDRQQLRQRLDEHRLTQVLHNLPAGNWAAGERGIACHPDRTAEFAAGVDQAIEYARRAGVHAGELPGRHRARRRRCRRKRTRRFVSNLRLAARRLESARIKLLIEPINTRDIPGFFLCRTLQAVEIIKAVASDNLFLQYDVYHMQIMEGDLAATFERYRPLIAHVQIADPPARHEPGTGEINFPFLLGRMDSLGYSGWIGCEDKPAGRTTEGLGWLRPYQASTV